MTIWAETTSIYGSRGTNLYPIVEPEIEKDGDEEEIILYVRD